MPEKMNSIDNMDVSNPELFQKDVWGPYFKKLRLERPVHYCSNSPYGPYWSITRYEDIKSVEINHSTYSSDSSRGGIRIDNKLKDSFISADPPRHTQERKTIAPVAAQANLAHYELIIRKRTKNLLLTLPHNETFDWVEKVSAELTVMMLATLFDFPFEQRSKLSFWSDASICDYSEPDALVKSDEERSAILYQMADAFMSLWQERIAKDPKPDLISMMAHDSAMRFMPQQQFIGNLVLLIVGGYDATKNSMSGGVLALSEHLDQRDKLISNPALISKLIGEIFRYQTPAIHMCRTATRDAMLLDQKIREGDRLVLWYLSGNRDESVIDEPDRFIIDRPKSNQHLSFGAGIHRCLGERLATLQLRVLWEEILAHNLIIDVVGEPVRQYSNFVRGIKRLPVQIRKRHES
jgi:cytochrome P450